MSRPYALPAPLLLVVGLVLALLTGATEATAAPELPEDPKAGPEGEPLDPLSLGEEDSEAGEVDEEASPADRAVVVAVIDSQLSPYHWDFVDHQMPQALAGDPLPLDEAPDTWLPGFTTDGLDSYEAFPITLAEWDDEWVADLRDEDAERWAEFPSSRPGAVNYRWIPGTKIIGALAFGTSSFVGDNDAHGTKSASVSVGNYHGTCPECLLVHIRYSGVAGGEAAIEWAMNQPWIDVITNSYGFSAVSRDRLYSGSDTDLQREASERGQTIFFSSGNGQANTFTAPNTTYFSSQEGPDWIVTVGAITPSGGGYTGSGKPADVSAPGMSYPSMGGHTVTGTGTFSGTSNATPTTAGLYASALGWARGELGGVRLQDDGVIARGAPVECGGAHDDCELADGALTAEELRTRLLHGAVRTSQGPNVGAFVNAPLPVTVDEYELATKGHGAYFGRINGDEDWQAEAVRITGPMDGSQPVLDRPDGEHDWMVVDSYCRQSIWGTWSGGYWAEGDDLPGPDPRWPLRSALATTCGEMFPPL
jgi:hypothetical protein